MTAADGQEIVRAMAQFGLTFWMVGVFVGVVMGILRT